MKLSITMNLRDMAPAESLHAEVARILSELSDKALSVDVVTELDGTHMRDAYGNTVGRVTIR